MTTYNTNDYELVPDYRGVFGWNEYSARNFADPDNEKIQPAFEVELFLKEHSIPIRKKKITEVTTIGSITGEGIEGGTQMVLEGAPELLTVSLAGWTRTPINAQGHYAPTDLEGNEVADLAGYSYSEIVSLYIEGHMNLTPFRALQRKDPDYFITPYGQKYLNPTISVWESAPQAGQPKKHNLTATVLLER